MGDVIDIGSIEVCPGSQTLSPTWQGVVAVSSIPTEGECGICGKTVPIDGFFNTITHGWTAADRRRARTEIDDRD